jgi:hypothetical protein
MIHKMMSAPKNGTNETKDHQREIPTRPKIRHDGINVATDSAAADATIKSLLWTIPPPRFRPSNTDSFARDRDRRQALCEPIAIKQRQLAERWPGFAAAI